MDHRIPQVLFPARAVASYPRRIRLNQARLKAEVHVITWNPWSPGPVLFCGLLNFRWMSVAYFLPKIVPTLCNCIIYWKKMKKKHARWWSGALERRTFQVVHGIWESLELSTHLKTVHQPQPILPQSSRTTPNHNPGREYGTRFTSQTYHFFSMFLLT